MLTERVARSACASCCLRYIMDLSIVYRYMTRLCWSRNGGAHRPTEPQPTRRLSAPAAPAAPAGRIREKSYLLICSSVHGPGSTCSTALLLPAHTTRHRSAHTGHREADATTCTRLSRVKISKSGPCQPWEVVSTLKMSIGYVGYNNKLPYMGE